MEYETSTQVLLERMLINEHMGPMRLPLSLLKHITDNFSDDLLIGSGGFATVYKGLLQNGTVAVKKLSMNNVVDFDEKDFLGEITSLLKLKAKHTNIVRLLGYCSDIQQEIVPHKGDLVLADVRQKLLLFEFLPEGSLRKHISDASKGLEWKTRYHILKGICEGLDYLHKNGVIHSDLKPENILLDDYKVPKIADFGLAKCFHKNQSQQVTADKGPVGTPGYMAPELFDSQPTGRKADIYSLGVIIMELLSGKKRCLDLDNVLQSWRTRFETSQGDIAWLDDVRICAEIGQKCTDSDPKKRPDTQDIIDMLKKMEQNYGSIQTGPCTSATQAGFPSEASKLLDVHPLELRFPFKRYKRELPRFPFERYKYIDECPTATTLTNRTDHYVGVWITPTDHHHFPVLWEQKPLEGPVFQMMEPRSSLAVRIAMDNKQRKPPAETGTLEVVMAVMGSMERLEKLKHFIESMPHVNKYILRIVEVVMVAIESNDLLEKLKSYFSLSNWKTVLKTIEGQITSIGIIGSKERFNTLRMYLSTMLKMQDSDVLREMEMLGGRVHREKLTAATYDIDDVREASPQQALIYSAHKVIPTSEFGDVTCMDVHPTETWILVGYKKGYVSIWNYQSEESVRTLWVSRDADGKSYRISSVKFIAAEKWLVAGDAAGCVHVYAYETEAKVSEFRACDDGHPVSSLAVQPTDSFMLTSSSVALTSTKLWYWGQDQDWRCVREFNESSGGVSHLAFNLRDNSTFATVSMDDEVKIWDTRMIHPTTTVPEKSTGACSFYTDRNGRHFLLTSASLADKSYAMIRDLVSHEVVHQLGVMGQSSVKDAACHPTLPILATAVTLDKRIYFWDYRTYRVDKIVELTDLPIRGMVFTGTDVARLIVPCSKGISIVELNQFAATTTGLLVGGEN